MRESGMCHLGTEALKANMPFANFLLPGLSAELQIKAAPSAGTGSQDDRGQLQLTCSRYAM